MKKYWEHFKTITEHRHVVCKGCFSVGLYWQGLTHDLSKYSPSEFLVGAKYYQGYRSPNNAEREDRGYSSAWLHHKGRNKHHYEYWIDYSSSGKNGMIPAHMPVRYLVEMYMDRIAASKIYNKGHFMQDMPLKYYLNGKSEVVMEKRSEQMLVHLLRMLAMKGEEETTAYIRKYVLRKRKRKS